MKPKLITFSKKKSNHFYAIKNEKEQFELITNPKKGDKVYEYAVISGGSGKEEKNNPLLLEIPIPSCEKHQHKGKNFIVKTCRGWSYIAIPTKLGSLRCRECHDELFLPEPYLRCADLSCADLSGANLSCADLSGADLSCADLSCADLKYADLSCANLSGANLSCADLSGANLSCADLRGADLKYADLRYADLSGANLKYADLRYADLSGADLRYADLSGADLRDALYSNYTLETIDSSWKSQLKKQGMKI